MRESDAQLKRLAERVGRHLLKARRHAATAESCTGGWIAKALTDIAGSSCWFSEGFVTYSDESKERQLGVPRTVLRRHGAVSEATVRAMAAGARTDAEKANAIESHLRQDYGYTLEMLPSASPCWRTCMRR